MMTATTAAGLAPDPAATAAADAFLQAAHGTPEGRRNPYPHYAGMRAAAPLYRSGLDGVWYATRYADCKAILTDPRAGRGPHRPAYGVAEAAAERFNARLGPTLILQNPPTHTRLRGLTRTAFSPRRVAVLGGRIRELAGSMLGTLAEAGTADIVPLLAYPLPLVVIAELVGVPAADRGRFGTFLRDFAAAAGADAGPAELAAAELAGADIDAYFADLLARRRAHPEDDLVTALAEARDGDGALTDDEITSTAFMLFAAGFATTTHAIGMGLLALLRNPDQQARLWADPGLAPDAVEEMLRYENPAQFVRRMMLEPMEIGGVRLAAGDDVVALPGAANRDPERFADPDRFDLTRPDNHTASFGYGIHHCLGAALARLEMRNVLELMVERFATVELADPDQPEPLTTWFLRGLDSLTLRVEPR